MSYMYLPRNLNWIFLCFSVAPVLHFSDGSLWGTPTTMARYPHTCQVNAHKNGTDHFPFRILKDSKTLIYSSWHFHTVFAQVVGNLWKVVVICKIRSKFACYAIFVDSHYGAGTDRFVHLISHWYSYDFIQKYKPAKKLPVVYNKNWNFYIRALFVLPN